MLYESGVVAAAVEGVAVARAETDAQLAVLNEPQVLGVQTTVLVNDLNRFIFSFLASGTGLASLLWLSIRGGFKF
jgi:hypothetical protein